MLPLVLHLLPASLLLCTCRNQGQSLSIHSQLLKEENNVKELPYSCYISFFHAADKVQNADTHIPEIIVSGLLPHLRREMQATTVDSSRTMPKITVARYLFISAPDS